MDEAGLRGSGRVLAEWALLLACRMKAVEGEFVDSSAESLLKKLRTDDYPPSAGQLAALCSMEADLHIPRSGGADCQRGS